MYPDLDQSEVVFVHKLASGTARSRALKKLHAIFKQRSEDGSLNAETFTRLSKGLHYAMWMQDKPILQQELAESIASLLDDLKTNREGAAFVKVFFEALSTEWHLVDRWRMDKFLMMALYVDELSKTGTVTKAVAHLFLDACLDILQENCATDFFFKSICDEIFQCLIYTAAEEIRKGDIEGEEDLDSDEEEDADDIVQLLRPIPCDFDKLGDRLFESGAEPTVNSKRRQRLYALSKKFKAIVQGKNPQEEPMEVSDKPAITKAKMHKAVEKLLEMQEKVQMDRQKHKKELKEMKIKQSAQKIADLLTSMISSTKSTKKIIKSSNKFKPNAIKKKSHHKSTSATASRRHVSSKGKISKLSSKKKQNFYLSLYPNGSEDKRRGKTCMFLYISFENPRKVVAKWNVTIESANFSFSCQKMYDQNQGWGKFICDTKDFFDPEKKFIVDGKCTVEVTGTFKFATENPSITDIGQKWEGGEFGDELWAKEETKDLRIIVDGKDIKVDKSILDVRSNALSLMLQTKMQESIDNEVTITDYTFEVVETGIKMIYDCNFTSSLSINDQMSLLQFFDKYALPTLKDKIESLLIKQISCSTVARLTNCSILTNTKKLKNVCFKFLMQCYELKTPFADMETLDKDIALNILLCSLYKPI